MGNPYIWSETYSVGVTSMDEHHKRLFAIIHRLHEASSENRAPEVMGGIVSDLLSYTRYHFTEEERCMESAGYEGLEVHQRYHREFIETVEEYRQRLDDGKTAFLHVATLAHLTDWLINHIGRQDKNYGAALQAKGID